MVTEVFLERMQTDFSPDLRAILLLCVSASLPVISPPTVQLASYSIDFPQLPFHAIDSAA